MNTIDISQAAAALGKKGGSSKSESKKAAVRENGKKGGRPTRNMVVMLFREGNQWTLTRYIGSAIPATSFKTATEARAYAAGKNWSVRRCQDCDD